MTEEDKELLLRDLCGRQMYNVKCQVFNDVNPYTLSGVLHNKPYSQLYFEELDWKEFDGFVGIEYCKPYLFPMSSMTEEQKKEFDTQTFEIMFGEFICKKNDEMEYGKLMAFDLDFYNKHHIDWRGLISKGLAIDATDKNIY